MSTGNANNVVAKELSDALSRCKQTGVDEQSLRTGLLTITIANFVNRIGMANTVALFAELPAQISSGIFDRYIDPETNTPAQLQYQPAAQQPSSQGSYHNAVLPQSFVQPYAQPQERYTAAAPQHQQTPTSYAQHPPHQASLETGKRRLVD